MRRRAERGLGGLLLAALVALGATGLLGAPAGAQETAPSEPTLTTERAAYQRGQTIRVEGEGWPGSSVFTVELCGNEAANGSVDCDKTNSLTVATTRDGTLFADLLATAPPSPCPCVVHVFTPGGEHDLAVRVEIEGVPEAPVGHREPPVRSVEVSDVEVDMHRSFASWFGAGPRATVRATVTNTGEVPVRDVDVRLRWGPTSKVTRPVDLDPIEEIAPGETAEVEAEVSLDALSFGERRFVVGVAGFESADRGASASAFPWGLVLVLLFAVAAVAFLLVVRARARRARGTGEAGAEAGDGGADGGAAGAAPEAAAAAAAPVALDKAGDADGPATEPGAAGADAGDGSAPDDVDDDALIRASAAKRLVAVVVLGILVTGAILGSCSLRNGSRKNTRAISAEQLCRELAEIDPGLSFAGGSAERLAEAVVRVHELADVVPEAIAPAFRVIADAAEADARVLDLPDLEQGDEDYAGAYQAAYALRFDGQVAVAAALLERYGVDECGMEPSGLFDIEALSEDDLEQPRTPVLSQGDIEELTVEFGPEDVEGFELEPFEIPEVRFDEDLEQFRLEVPEIPQPDLGG